jgi:RND family efflux transporter MFP subunit
MDNRAAAARKHRSDALVSQEAVNLREQRQRLGRLRQLAANDAVSEEEVDQAELRVEAARAAWKVAQAEAKVIAVEQDWQKLRAPFDALVVKKTTEAGQWVEAGTKMFQLVALEGWEVEAHLDSIDSGRVRVGQIVKLRSGAFPDKVWESKIQWIGPTVEQESERHLNTFPVRMDLGDDAPHLLLGQQLDIEIPIERRTQALSLPFTALREKETGGFEVAVLEKGEVRFQAVQTGLETDTHVEILAGLEEGMQVLPLDGEPIKAGDAAYFAENDSD